MKKAKYLIEKYTDKYRSLYQAVMINLEIDEATNGMESKYIRSQVNPNLNILLEKEYYDKNMKLLKKEILINDNWYFEE